MALRFPRSSNKFFLNYIGGDEKLFKVILNYIRTLKYCAGNIPKQVTFAIWSQFKNYWILWKRQCDDDFLEYVAKKHGKE